MAEVDIFEVSEMVEYGRKLIFISAKFPNLEPLILPEFGIKIYSLCNIFPTVGFGINIQVGAYTEIGNRVQIGDNVRIGAMCFIPEGVIIKSGAWISPRVCFTNDRFPPSNKSQWEKTTIEKNVSIGSSTTVLCGLTIGEGALVGAGSTVVKNIPAGEIWAGNPAIKLRNKPQP